MGDYSLPLLKEVPFRNLARKPHSFKFFDLNFNLEILVSQHVHTFINFKTTCVTYEHIFPCGELIYFAPCANHQNNHKMHKIP